VFLVVDVLLPPYTDTDDNDRIAVDVCFCATSARLLLGINRNPEHRAEKRRSDDDINVDEVIEFIILVLVLVQVLFY